MRKEKNAWVVSLVIFIIWLIIVMGGHLLQTGGGETSLDELVTKSVLIEFVLAPLFLLAVVAYLKWWHATALDTLGHFGKYIYLWLPLIYIAYHSVDAIRGGLPTGNIITLIFINTLLVGISEELMFRGVLFHGAWTKFDAIKAVWITGLIFGGVHSLNGFITGDFIGATGQALAAFSMGVFFGALRLHLASIYPLMIIHWLWDFSVFLGTVGMEGPTQAELSQVPSFALPLMSLVFPFLLNLPLLIFGIWLLRKWKREHAETATTEPVAV